MESYTYDAFISYRHVERDKSVAVKLQKLLETYKPPKGSNYSNTNKIRKVFRDESELPTSGDLGLDIKRALEQSAFLIVICSEETSKSQWCMEEINYYKELHKGNNEKILALLVSGNPREVFPKELCYESRIIKLSDGSEQLQSIEVEPLAANVTAQTTRASIKKLKTEFLRIAAPILGCGFDDLYRRHQRRFVRKILFSAAAVVTVLLSFSGFSYTQYVKINNQSKQILSQKVEIENAYSKLEQTNNQLSAINSELEKTNNMLSAQINETNKQRNIAETNRLEAENQTVLARENERRAIDNLNSAREQQLFRTISYAKQLSDGGDKVQAAAILSEAYDRFDKKSDNYLSFKNQIETSMVNTAYYPDYSIYTKLSIQGSISTAAFSEDDTMVAAGSGNTVTVWNTSNGEKMRCFNHKAEVTALYFKNHYLITGTKESVIYIWNLDTGKLMLETQLANNSNSLEKIQQITCNDNINSIVADYGYYQSNLGFIPYPWINQRDNSYKVQKFYLNRLSISDNGKYIISKDISKLTVMDLNKFNFKSSSENNLQNMTIYSEKHDHVIDNDFKINNEGIIYYRAAESDSVLSEDLKSYAYIYNIEKHYLIKKFEVGSFASITLKNNLESNIVMNDLHNIYFLDLNFDDPVSQAKTVSINYDTDHLHLYYIPNTNLIMFWNSLRRDGCNIYDLKGEKLTQLQDLPASISFSTASHDSSTILTSSEDGSIYLYKRNHNYGYIEHTGVPGKYIGSNIHFISDTGNILVANNGGDLNRTPMAYNVKSKSVVSKLSYSSKDYTFFKCFGMSTDDKLLFGFESKTYTSKECIRIWDLKTGKIVNSLDLLNAKMPSESGCHFGISPDFKFIIASYLYDCYVYSIEENKIIYSFKLDNMGDYIGIENDGHTVWILDCTHANVTIVDLKDSTNRINKSIDISGNFIYNASLDISKDRIIVRSEDSEGANTNQDIGVYSLSTGKEIISLSKVVGIKYVWDISNNTDYVYTSIDGTDYIITIPTFENILGDIKKIGKGRVLTSKERELSGLSLFDY